MTDIAISSNCKIPEGFYIHTLENMLPDIRQQLNLSGEVTYCQIGHLRFVPFDGTPEINVEVCFALYFHDDELVQAMITEHETEDEAKAWSDAIMSEIDGDHVVH